MNSIVKRAVGVMLFSVVILAGCAAVDLAYLPDPAKKSPLGTLIKPMTITLDVEDQRKINEREWVAFNKIKAKEEVTIILHNALKDELENNGHKVVDPQDRHSDVIINVRLKKFWAAPMNNILTDRSVGTIYTEVVIINPRNNSVFGTRSISSTIQTGGVAYRNIFKIILNRTLAEFIRNFSRDPNILAALGLAQQQKG